MEESFGCLYRFVIIAIAGMILIMFPAFLTSVMMESDAAARFITSAIYIAGTIWFIRTPFGSFHLVKGFAICGCVIFVIAMLLGKG